MIKRTFFTIEEAVAAFDGQAMLLAELIELHGLQMYYRFERVSATHMDNGDFWDSLRSSGKHELANWWYFEGKPNPEDPEEDTGRYSLTGWFQLDRSTSMRLFDGIAESNPSAASFKDGEQFGHFFQLQISNIFPKNARFLVADIEQYKERVNGGDPSTGADRPLDKRERITLLNIIGALAEAAQVDLSKHHKAGETIAAMLNAEGVKLSARTIGEHLRAVRDAMASRKE